jgi:uncharacterized protein YdeI (YjbR/CyaY-like superfamily)
MTKSITAYKREDFRSWLKKNHKKEKRLAIILFKKHTGKPTPSHKELMEEAICYGWIDTTIKRLDDERFIRNFSKRNKNSKWSENTLSYAKDLIKRGMMKEQGLEFFKLGKKKPTHDIDIPKNPNIPRKLREELEKNKKAKENFSKYSKSTKRILYRWLLSGKQEQTREKRIKRIIKLSKEGENEIFN